MKLAIVRIGDVDTETVHQVVHGLSQILPTMECTLSEQIMPVPREAFNTARNQYHSTRILTKIEGYSKKLGANAVLGVTEVDLYVLGLNFVFGEAQYQGRAAIISLFRLHPKFYNQPHSQRLLNERAVKEAVHEVGHTLGLKHCSNPQCVMFFSNSILDTDQENSKLCEKCSTRIERLTRKKAPKPLGFRNEAS